MPEVDVKRVRRTAVSPELALIDPELARMERSRLDEQAKLDAYKSTPRRFTHSWEEIERLRRAVAAAEEEQRARRRRRSGARSPTWTRVMILLGSAAVVAGGVVAALKSSRDHPQATSPTSRPRTVAATATARARSDAGRAAVEAGRSRPARALEARLLTLVAEAPPSKLPRQLVDPQTGRVRTYLRATCRPSGTHVFLCIIQAPRRPRGEGLYVRYRLRSGGAGTFAWLGYRHR